MSDAEHTDFQRIHGIVNFMREATGFIDAEAALSQSGITNIENFTENQLTHFLVQTGIKSPHIKELFYALNVADTKDIRLINSQLDIFEFFTVIAGGLYYAKSIRRLIKKDDIIKIKEVLTDDGYHFVFEFSKDKSCIEDYPLFIHFEQHFKAIGHYILKCYLNNMNQTVTYFLLNKLTLPTPLQKIDHLRISNQYALDLAYKTRDFIIQQSE